MTASQPTGSPRIEPSRLTELISRMCDDGLTPDETVELETMLRGDAAARRFYYEFIHCHGHLRWPSAQLHSSPAAPARDMAAAEVLPSLEAAVASNVSIEAGGARAVRSPVLGFLGGVVDYVSHSRTLMFWLIFTSLIGYFGVHLGALLLSRFWAQNAAQVADGRDSGRNRLSGRHGQPGAAAATGKVVARLTNAVDCRWRLAAIGDASHVQPSEAIEFDIGTNFRVGQALNLTAGLAEITFDSGAKVILHAPARFEPAGAQGGDLQLGRLVAKVPHTATGFTIGTPGGKVVDLGTEFGVKVNEDGATHVVVYIGQVKVEAGADGSGRGGDQPAVTVKAGEAVIVSAGKPIKPAVALDERFVRDLTPLGDKTKAEAAYVELIRKLKPVVWFRMEGKDADRTIHDEMGNAPDGQLHWDGPGKAFVGGRVGKSLWLRGPQLNDYALVPDYPKADKGRLSVVAWVYADSHPNYAGIAKNYGEGGRGQFSFTLMNETNAQDKEGDLGLYLVQPDGKQIILREGADHPLPLYQWQHVAFTTDGSTARLYRQGREVASGKHNGLRYPVLQKSLGIGVKIGDDDHTPAGDHPSYWSGKIDELAIFNDTLSADDIRRLATAPLQ